MPRAHRVSRGRPQPWSASPLENDYGGWPLCASAAMLCRCPGLPFPRGGPIFAAEFNFAKGGGPMSHGSAERSVQLVRGRRV